MTILIHLVLLFLYHKQTKICRPTQHFNALSHTTTCFDSHEPSSGTSFYNGLQTQVALSEAISAFVNILMTFLEQDDWPFIPTGWWDPGSGPQLMAYLIGVHTYTHNSPKDKREFIMLQPITCSTRVPYRNIYIYVVNQNMHTDKICFTIYNYSPTCFGHFCDYHQGAITGTMVKGKQNSKLPE
jgi:hypothetical protein